MILDPQLQKSWMLTGYYGEPKTSKRSVAWQFFQSLKSIPSTLLLVFEDFNDILLQEAKVGRRLRSELLMNNFKKGSQKMQPHGFGTQERIFHVE